MRAFPVFENLLFFFLLAFFVAAPASVAYSESALGLVLFLWAARLAACRGRVPPVRAVPRLGTLLLPVAAFAFASALSALFAVEKGASAAKLVKLLPMALLFFLPQLLFTGPRLRHALGALLFGGAITSAYGIGYHLFVDSSTRLGGFIGFYMSQAGILMQVSLLAFTIVFTERSLSRLRSIASLSLPLLLAALYLTDTRGAWLGLLAGMIAVVIHLGRRFALVLLAVLVLLVLVPEKPRRTVLSAFDPGHPRNRERLFMWKAGLEIFRDHPWTGVGLGGMRRIYLEYQDPRSREDAVHLHNVPIQLLASMGLVGFAAWVYLFGSVLVWLLRAVRRVRAGPPGGRAAAVAAVAVWIGFVAGGLVEWNLGDVEVVTLFWAMMGLAVSAVAASPGVGSQG